MRNLSLFARRRTSQSGGSSRNESLTGWSFVLPAVIVLATFSGFSILFGLGVSFFKWGIRPEKFVGLSNYVSLLTDGSFWKSLGITVSYVLLVVPAELITALLFATILNKKFWGRGIVRLLFFLPYVTSLVAAGLVFRWMFNPTQGLINLGLSAMNLPEPRWLLESTGIFTLIGRGLHINVPASLGGPSLALIVISMVTIWYYTGSNSLIFLAGLSSIPQEVYEAARVDGANRFQTFLHITIPLVSPTLYSLAILVTIGAFQSFSLIFAMTGSSYGTGASGAPLGTTKVITLYIFDEFYRYTNTGYAMAAGIILLVILVILTLVQMGLFGRKVVYLGGDK